MLDIVRREWAASPTPARNIQKPDLRGSRAVIPRARPVKSIPAIHNRLAIWRIIRVIDRGIILAENFGPQRLHIESIESVILGIPPAREKQLSKMKTPGKS